MNRHDRRKAVKMGRTVEVLSGDSAKRALEGLGGCMCKWSGCAETFPSGPLPEGWRFLIVHHNATPCDLAKIAPDKWDHDAVLCPQHAAEIDRSLKDLSLPAGMPAAGTA